jgi:hypothetical protein
MKVFWSWQSDTPGRTGRHLVRDALDAAIQELKQLSDVEEPHERENKEALHLDHDRKGVRGSPPLADTILAKIDSSQVFIADVTPVAVVLGDKEGDPIKKRTMNPNVAIELGYALKVLGSDILMVLNEHYGGRETLPFDLAHLGGPIIYKLAPDADAKTREAAAKTLRARFVEALTPYVQRPTSVAPTHQAIPATSNRAIYFQLGEVLARFGENYDNEEFGYDLADGIYLRLAPTVPQPQTPVATLLSSLQSSNLRPFYRDRGVVAVNQYGPLLCDFVPKTGRLKGSTQLFPNKELWGFTTGVVQNQGGPKAFPVGGFERALRTALPSYVAFMAGSLGVGPPYRVEAGAVGIAGRALMGDVGDAAGTIYENEFSATHILGATSQQAINDVLLRIFEGLFAMADAKRPPGLFGFPPPS